MITRSYSGVTLNGFYRYDPNLFDGLLFPSGTFQRSTFISVLRRRWGEAMPYLQNPAQLSSMISVWGEEQQDNFKMLWAAFTASYNPIHNYDATEEETETPDIKIEETGNVNSSRSGEDGYQQMGEDKVTRSGTDTSSASGTDTTMRTGTDTNSQSGSDSKNMGGDDTNTQSGTDTVTRTGTDTLTKDNRAYNSGALTTTGEDTSTRNLSDDTAYGRKDTRTYTSDEVTMYGRKDSRQTSDKDDTTYGRKDTREISGEDITTYGRGNTITYGRKDDQASHSVRTETGERKRNLRRVGNIGVTTSAQMLQAELAMRRNFDPYTYIADLFADEFLSHVM